MAVPVALMCLLEIVSITTGQVIDTRGLVACGPTQEQVQEADNSCRALETRYPGTLCRTKLFCGVLTQGGNCIPPKQGESGERTENLW